MLRTTVTPDHANIELAIPESYVGKQIEVLVYTIDEIQSEPKVAMLVEPKETTPQKPSDFKKILSDETVSGFEVYLKKSREEWQDRI